MHTYGYGSGRYIKIEHRKRSSERQKFQIRREKEVSSRLIKVNSDSKHGGRYAKGKTKGKPAIVHVIN